MEGRGGDRAAGAGGARAAPEGEFGRVSAYVDETGTLTVDTLTAAVGAGDLYGLVSEYFPLQQMIVLANLALSEPGGYFHGRYDHAGHRDRPKRVPGSGGVEAQAAAGDRYPGECGTR